MNRFYLTIKFLFDKSIPLKEKWCLIIPIIYILSPIDLIPAPVFGFSIIDDIVIFVFLLSKINEKTKKYYGDDYKYKKSESDSNQDIINKEKIINDVDYEIK